MYATYAGEDTRVFERIAGELVVRYRPSKSSKEYYATTKNISGGGIKILTTNRLVKGTVLDLEIFKNNSNVSANCTGEIVWVEQVPCNSFDNKKKCFEAGIKFTNMCLFYIADIINALKDADKSSIEQEVLSIA